MSLQTNDNREGFSRDFLFSKGWESCICTNCGKTFYVKLSSKISRTSCGRNKYNDDEHEFKTLPKRKQLLRPFEIRNIISSHFTSVGYDERHHMNIVNNEGLTDLVVAGVQVFDGFIHRGRSPILGKFFIGQPSIRTQFQPLVSTQEGTSTAFVNVCTEEMNSSIEGHMESIDQWCSALSKLGLRMDDFTIVQKISENNWGTGPFAALELFFCYKGLELGDAAFMSVPTTNGPVVLISDIGFGLERIAWVINKTDSYFDLLSPLTSDYPREMLDLCRSSALLLLDGVTASNKGAGLQLRRFVKILVEKYYCDDILHLVAYYIQYWKSFSLYQVMVESVDHVKIEIDRLINLKISNLLELPPPRTGELTEAYFERLVYTCNANINDLRQAIQSCKT